MPGQYGAELGVVEIILIQVSKEGSKKAVLRKVHRCGVL